MGVADAIASRYRRRGVADEDLQQVAYLALTKAARKFDPDAGHDFLSYAVPTIRGELCRYFRDSGWMVRPPRKVQELQSRIFAAQSELSLTLGRSPSPREVAAHLERAARRRRGGAGRRGLLHPHEPGPLGRPPTPTSPSATCSPATTSPSRRRRPAWCWPPSYAA